MSVVAQCRVNGIKTTNIEHCKIKEKAEVQKFSGTYREDHARLLRQPVRKKERQKKEYKERKEGRK
jgi:hypothetical protein